MQHFCVVQHTYSEFLGLIEKQLEKRNIGFSYFRPFVGQAVPGSAVQYDALFLLAGAWPITDTEHCPWVSEELDLIKIFQKVGRPVVGIGFGALEVAAAAGAESSDAPFHTACWTTAHMTAAGRGDALAEAVDGRRVLAMYNGSARLPAGVDPLVVDDAGNWLAIRPDPLTYGMLFRPEVKPGMLEDILMEAKRQAPDNMGDLIATARQEWNETQRTTDQVIVALVNELSLMRERHKPPVFSLKIEN
ncbi:MAG: GMP synthase [Chromatiales bacterium 21-64-14]|nr:MAG: GMP synthase [Chromatiales bacterium 21-64-14]HQU16925.1 GMP synthase [Gammaproteobacteria bacterium]